MSSFEALCNFRINIEENIGFDLLSIQYIDYIEKKNVQSTIDSDFIWVIYKSLKLFPFEVNEKMVFLF